MGHPHDSSSTLLLREKEINSGRSKVSSNTHVTMFVALVGLVGVLFGAMLSLVGVAITAFFTSRNNNKNIFINTVTSERAKWRDELRSNTAEFCSVVRGELQNYAESNDRLRQEELRVLIRLRLNPDPTHKLDKAILDAISKLAWTEHKSGESDVIRELEAIESNVQALLKQEWEKSKQEAREGKLVSKPKSAFDLPSLPPRSFP